MGKRDPRVDAYIERSADFARPILTRVRQLVHEACPDVQETVKWGAPHFDYQGLLCGMAAFKRHCNVILWKASLVVGEGANQAGGPLRDITKLSDLPSDKTLKGWISEAAKLNEQGVKASRTTRPKKDLVVPTELTRALSRNRKAAAAFEKFRRATSASTLSGSRTRKRARLASVAWQPRSSGWLRESLETGSTKNADPPTKQGAQ